MGSPMSSAFTKAMSNIIQRVTYSNPIAGGVMAAVVGGTASKIMGGSFANGAMTAGFAYLFNHSMSQRKSNMNPNRVPNGPDPDPFGKYLKPSKVRAISTFGLSLAAEYLADTLEPGVFRGIANTAAFFFSTTSAAESCAITFISGAGTILMIKSGNVLGAVGFGMTTAGFGYLTYRNFYDAHDYANNAIKDLF